MRCRRGPVPPRDVEICTGEQSGCDAQRVRSSAAVEGTRHEEIVVELRLVDIDLQGRVRAGDELISPIASDKPIELLETAAADISAR